MLEYFRRIHLLQACGVPGDRRYTTDELINYAMSAAGNNPGEVPTNYALSYVLALAGINRCSSVA